MTKFRVPHEVQRHRSWQGPVRGLGEEREES